MSTQPSSGRGIAVKTFLATWVVLIAVLVTFTLVPFGQSSIAKASSLDFLGFLILLAPNLLLALWAGLFLGPRLNSVGYLKSIGWQMLVGIIWAIVLGMWIFVVLFHRECLQAIIGKYPLGSLLHIFSVRIVEVVATNCVLLIPIILVSSGITVFLSHRRQSAV